MESVNDQENTVEDIELVDIEDIVPSGGNSMFLSCARALIYMSHKNSALAAALAACSGIDLALFKNDLQLQCFLRTRLCEYFCKHGVVSDRTRSQVFLREEYAKYFNGNVFDFLVQVYQLSINNFSNNALYRKYALVSICQILNMKIYFKKANGQWKLYEPLSARLIQRPLAPLHKFTDMIEIEANLRSEDRKKHLDILNESIIYLQEFRTETQSKSAKLSGKKSVRILLNKRLWLSKHLDNSQICMSFSQFNDADELRKYQEAFFSLPVNRIVALLNPVTHYDPIYKAFCVFISVAPVHLLLHCESKSVEIKFSNNASETQTMDFEFSAEFNTIGKQIKKLQSVGKEKLYEFFNHLWGKLLFNDDYVHFKYSLIATDPEN